MGGDSMVSVPERELIRRAAAIAVYSHDYEQMLMTENYSEMDKKDLIEMHMALSKTMAVIVGRVGLRRRSREVSAPQSIAEYLEAQ